MDKDIFDELVVVKRSGQRVNFNHYKIAVVIKRAFDNVYDDYNEKVVNKLYEKVLQYIEDNYKNRKTINVEDIQDIIENTLKTDKHEEVYEAFSEYRQKRAASRKVFIVKQEHKFLKAMEKIADENLLEEDNHFLSNEIINKYGKTVVKELSKAYLIDNKFLRIHDEGHIYIHDIDLFSLGMLSNTHLNLNHIFKQDISNIVLELIKVKSEISGEINIPSIDYLLEKSVLKLHKEKFKEKIICYLKLSGHLDYININKLIEQIDKEDKLLINLEDYNEYIRSDIVRNLFVDANNEVISSSNKIIKSNIITLLEILNKEKGFTISFGSSLSDFGVIINKIILEVLLENNLDNLNVNVKVFKNSIYLDEIYVLASNRDISLSFIDNSYNKDTNKEVEYFSDGIRLFENINRSTKDSIGRMVVGKTSINLARLALENKDSINNFYTELDEVLELVKNNLLLIFETIGNKNKENYEKLFTGNILDDEKLEEKQKIRKVIKNGNLLIGIVGLKEAVSTLVIKDTKQVEFILNLLDHLNHKCAEYMVETKLNFGIYEPYEERVRKELIALDKTIYGIVKEITDDNKYNLISDLPILKDDYKNISKIQKLFTCGNVLNIKIPKNISENKFYALIEKLIEEDIGFVNIKTGK